MKNLKNFLKESILDVNKDDLKDQIQEKYAKDKKPYPNVKVVDVGENFIRISAPNPNGDFIPDSIFRDMKILEVENLYLDTFVTFQIDNNVDATGLTVYVPDVFHTSTYKMKFSSKKPVVLSGLTIKPEDKTDYAQIRIVNSSKFTFKNCDIDVTAIRLDNPEMITFKNCNINDSLDGEDGVVFDVVGSNKYVAQACKDALEGDFKGFEKLGFTPKDLKTNKFIVYYAEIEDGMDKNSHTFVYKNNKWSESKPMW